MFINASMTLRRVFRLRPLAIETLEEVSGSKCWNHLDLSLAQFGRLAALDAEALSERLRELPVLHADTPWTDKPLYYLVDYLTTGHHIFQNWDLPGILRLFEVPSMPAYPDGYVVKLAYQEFRSFDQEFNRHMEEEETFLFPKMLANEACLRYASLPAGLYMGSVNAYAINNHRPDEEFKHMLTSLKEKLRNQRVQDQTAKVTGKILEALEAFEASLTAHADLETHVLFPRAAEMENRLYGREAAFSRRSL